jgi:hypothetical protein
VAREAGVSVPTVYAAYGNRTGLVRAVADAAGFPAPSSGGGAKPWPANFSRPGPDTLAARRTYPRRTRWT